MEGRSRRIGYAKRIRVRLALGAQHEAWDCRPFGFGRVVAPTLPTQVEIARGTYLDLQSGEVRAAARRATAA